MDAGGLSWADQWDYSSHDPLPPPATEDVNKEGKDGSGKSKNEKKKISFKWVKDLCKKSHK